MDDDPETVYSMYKMREVVDQDLDAMKNGLEDDKACLHTIDGMSGYFFISTSGFLGCRRQRECRRRFP